MEETEKFLRQYRDSLKEWNRLCDEAEQLRAASTRITSNFSGMPGGGDVPTKVESALEGIEDILARADATKLLVDARRAEVEAAINALPGGRHREVMRLRYLNGMSWSRIAERLHYDKRHVLRLRAEAIKMIQEKRCH